MITLLLLLHIDFGRSLTLHFSTRLMFALDFPYVAHLRNQSVLKAKFCTFTLSVKISGGIQRDTQLLWSMRLKEFDSRKPVLESCVSSVQQWYARRRLQCHMQLNEDKSELIWFASRFMLKKLTAKDTTMTVGSAIIKPAESVRNIAVILDSQLTMQAHITKVASSCFFHLRRLRQLRHVVAQDVRQRLVLALVLSRVDYCNSSLAGLPAIARAPLQKVLNAATRYVANLRPRDCVKSVQRSLHWLPIHQRIQYKLCILMYGAAHGYAPDYIYINNLATLTSAT